MNTVRWGLIGPGRIAQRFADALPAVEGAVLAAVAGRDADRARAFAERWSPPGALARVHASAQSLVDDDGVDAVYIATPHPFHDDAVRATLRAGKAVLCEKPLTVSAGRAESLVAAARDREVLLMEAMWTRFLPAYAAVQAWLQARAIGRVHTLRSSFCFRLPHDPAGRHFDPAQAGGTLLDIGIYNLSVSQWVMATLGMHDEPAFEITGRLGPTGVDVAAEGTLHWPDGTASHFRCAFDDVADNAFVIEGDNGRIVLPGGFWHAVRAERHAADGSVEAVDAPFRRNGFEYQIEQAMQALHEGRVECPAIPHAHTLATLRLIDAMRARLGVHYPWEPLSGSA